jgi:hypothetical protein
VNRFLYVNTGDDAVECSVVGASSTQAGSLDVASLTWEDSSSGDDPRDVTVEVRHVGGTCSGSDSWTLLLEGKAP